MATHLSAAEEAEVSRTCERGLASYLADKHSQNRAKSTRTGVIVGIVGGIVTFMLAEPMHFKPAYAAIPAAAGVMSGLAHGLLTNDKQDLTYEEEFNSVCSSLDTEEDEEEDEDEDF